MSFELSPARVTRTLFAGVVLLHAASFGGQYSKYFLGHDYLLGFVPKTFVGTDFNVPTWFSSVLLLACAAALAVAALTRPARARDFRFWIALAVLFTYMSMDEAAGLHELAIRPLRAALAARFGASSVEGYLHLPWVIPFGLFALAVFAAALPFLTRLPGRTSARFIFAGGVYLSGAMGVETLGAPYVAALGLEDWTVTMILTAEEALEMLGALLFFHAILCHLAGQRDSIRITLSAGGPSNASEVAPRIAYQGPAALPRGAAAAVVHTAHIAAV